MPKWKTLDLDPASEVSDEGQVRQKTIVLGGYEFTDFVRKPSVTKHGYEYLGFRGSDGTQVNQYVHRLVAQAFVPNPDNKPWVNHINGAKCDNRAVNLEWVTPAENAQHARDNGLMHYPLGEKHHSSTLTDEQVKCIKDRLRKGEKGAVLAREFKVTPSLISHIKAGRRWPHID